MAPPHPRSPRPSRRTLPRGSQALPREQVVADQLQRLLLAMIDSVGEKGYRATTISDLVGRAGVSRKTFYEHFASKQECLLATFDVIAADGRRRAIDAYTQADGLQQGVEAAIGALFAATIASPSAARLNMVEIVAAGPAGIERRERAAAEYRRFLRGMLQQEPDDVQQEPDDAAVPDAVVRAVVGGLNRILYSLVRHSQRPELHQLVTDLMRWVTCYRPTPAILAQYEEAAAPAAVADSGLRGGRAPGTLASYAGGELKLARGMTNVLRSFALHSQRERILDAVANLTATGGYADLTVEKIAGEAAMSLQTFYDHFKSKEEAFLFAYEVGHSRGLALVERAYTAQSDWPRGVKAAIATLLRYLGSEPAFARLALLHMLIATPRTAERANAGITEYLSVLEPGFEETPEHRRPPAITIEAIGGGLFELMYHCIMRDRVAALPSLTTHATYVALAPFVGPEHAAQVAIEPLPEPLS
ncbi:MAG TPA: TetR/AcrR family transcriptional regulator [Solirubrobacteraceae bacterium]